MLIRNFPQKLILFLSLLFRREKVAKTSRSDFFATKMRSFSTKMKTRYAQTVHFCLENFTVLVPAK